MKIRFRIAIAAGIMMCFLPGLAACNKPADNVVSKMDTAMGTIFSQKIYYAENAEADELPETIIGKVNELETTLLSRRLETAEVWQMNRALEQGETVVDLNPSVELKQILDKCLEVSKASDGAFDITIGKLAELWNIDKEVGNADYQLPQASDITYERERCGYEKIAVQNANYLVDCGIALDLGAVGKGVALDEIHKLLQENKDIKGAIISAGGSILTYGEKENGEPWKVAVVDPQNPTQTIGYLALEGQWCVSTSGDYERYVEVDGVRYHHIINPNTGYPADSGLRSVTIVCKDGLLSDALSTACFVLGAERGMELAKQYNVGAVLVDTQGNITMTESMETYWKPDA